MATVGLAEALMLALDLLELQRQVRGA